MYIMNSGKNCIVLQMLIISARRTCVQTVKRAKVQDRDIARLTGHKDLKSLDDYDEPTFEEQRQLSHAITRKMAPSATVTSGSTGVITDITNIPVCDNSAISIDIEDLWKNYVVQDDEMSALAATNDNDRVTLNTGVSSQHHRVQ